MIRTESEQVKLVEISFYHAGKITASMFAVLRRWFLEKVEGGKSILNNEKDN